MTQTQPDPATIALEAPREGAAVAKPDGTGSTAPDSLSLGIAPILAEEATSYQKERAGWVFRNALVRGEVLAPTACESCGMEETDTEIRAIIAHHWSYADAHHLDVIGLCRRCHLLVHNGRMVEPRTGRTYRRKSESRPKPAPARSIGPRRSERVPVPAPEREHTPGADRLPKSPAWPDFGGGL